jgi:hypothetical protein
MDFWRNHMPDRMFLKSDGFASNLYDPDHNFTLQRFCADQKIAYADLGVPVSLRTFVSYGLAFARAYVPDVEENLIIFVRHRGTGFELQVDTGATLTADCVVVATGIEPFAHVPPNLIDLPSAFVSHSSQQRDLTKFRGQRVVVIGGGASATDLAVLLDAEGAQVQIVARRNVLRFNDRPPVKEFSRALLHQLREPLSGIGPGWRNKMLGDVPWLVWYLPLSLRLKLVRRSHGPAGGWFAQEKIGAGLSVLLGSSVEQIDVRGGLLHMRVRRPNAHDAEIVADHAIAATGYRVDLHRLTFLSPDILSHLEMVDGAPVLSPKLESSVLGLYFVGAPAALCFGPVLRFAFGAGFTSLRLSRVLARRFA